MTKLRRRYNDFVTIYDHLMIFRKSGPTTTFGAQTAYNRQWLAKKQLNVSGVLF